MDDMQCLLHGCTALKYLHCQAINGLSSFHITSMTIRTIYVCCWCSNKRSRKVYHSMVTEDTPLLERLLVVDQQGPTRTNVIYVLKLTLVGYLFVKYSEPVIGSTLVQKMVPTSLILNMCVVKVWAQESINPNLEQVVSFLICFPCLEKLYIKVMFLSC
ncbi:hypothetical protein ZWY2020_028137 [Hordeum vulgare]|nr:hypothetical protein ZWY2020_028137 [Hordeum vulgare]